MKGLAEESHLSLVQAAGQSLFRIEMPTLTTPTRGFIRTGWCIGAIDSGPAPGAIHYSKAARVAPDTASLAKAT